MLTKSVQTQNYRKQNMHTQTSNPNSWKEVLSILSFLKKHTRPGHAGDVDPSVGFIDTRFFFKERKKEWTETT